MDGGVTVSSFKLQVCWRAGATSTIHCRYWLAAGGATTPTVYEITSRLSRHGTLRPRCADEGCQSFMRYVCATLPGCGLGGRRRRAGGATCQAARRARVPHGLGAAGSRSVLLALLGPLADGRRRSSRDIFPPDNEIMAGGDARDGVLECRHEPVNGDGATDEGDAEELEDMGAAEDD